MRWLPFVAAAAVLMVLLGLDDTPWGAGTILAAAGVGAGWLLGKRLWASALLVAALASPLAWQQLVLVPQARSELAGGAAANPGEKLRVTGMIRNREAGPGMDEHTVLLGRAMVERGDSRWFVPEVEVRFAGGWRPWGSYRRHIRIVGQPCQPLPARASPGVGSRLRLDLGNARVRLMDRPLEAHGREWLQHTLGDRAGYYLANRSLALYRPILLGIREADSPEARSVAATFRRIGVAHLFAISGLHVGLLFFLFLGALRLSARPALQGQGPVRGALWLRPAALAVIWAYVALIGFPIPAVRAAAMGTALVWSGLAGTRSSPYYVLGVTALAFLAIDPSQIHDVSFQLSFLAYLFVVVAVTIWDTRPQNLALREQRTWWRTLRDGTLLNLLVTLTITAGLWPVMASTFGRVSLLVFAGNLLMVPLLSVLVLPAGLAALAVSAAHLGALPGGWMERAVFATLDVALRLWGGIAELIDMAGAGGELRFHLDWGAGAFAAYYGPLAVGLWALTRWLALRQRNFHPPSGRAGGTPYRGSEPLP